MSGRTVTVTMSGRTAIGLRYLLPILSTVLEPGDDDAKTTVAMLEQAIADLDRALPPEFRGAIDNHLIAEYRMDAIDQQREEGVRPLAGDLKEPNGG